MAACHHVARLTPEFLLQFGLDPRAKRCRANDFA
jgi:hypothetical protein